MVRTAREHDVIMTRNVISNHNDMQDKYCGHCYDIHPLQSVYTKVAAAGRHRERGRVAFGRATSFVVAFKLACKRVNAGAVATMLLLRIGVI